MRQPRKTIFSSDLIALHQKFCIIFLKMPFFPPFFSFLGPKGGGGFRPFAPPLVRHCSCTKVGQGGGVWFSLIAKDHTSCNIIQFLTFLNFMSSSLKLTLVHLKWQLLSFEIILSSQMAILFTVSMSFTTLFFHTKLWIIVLGQYTSFHVYCISKSICLISYRQRRKHSAHTSATQQCQLH